MTDYEIYSAMLRVNSETGQLFWRQVRQGRPVHKEAGCIGHEGYRYVTIDGKQVRAHRIVWLLVHKEWPKQDIDHINRRKV